MGQSRRNFLEGLAATGSLAAFSGCIEIEIEREKDYHGEKDKEDYQETSSTSKVGDELEPDKGTDVGEELENNSYEKDQEKTETGYPEESSICDSGYIETHISIGYGETVSFEEPPNVEGGRYTRQGTLTNEGDVIRIDYGPSMVYLDRQNRAYFSFEQGPFGDDDYGDYNGRFFELDDWNSEEAVVSTSLVKDQWMFNRREAIGVCMDP